MEINELSTFVSVAKTGSFSKAGEQLHLSQPAVSKRIASLEMALNHALFDRIDRCVQLTPAGEALLPRAEKIIQEVSETKRSIQELSGEISGVLRVITSHHIGLHHLPPILRRFAEQHPDVDLKFKFLNSERAQEHILRGECELAVVTLPENAHKKIALNTVWRDPLLFVASKERSMMDKAFTPQELCKYPAILPSSNTITGRLVRDYFDQFGLQINVGMSTNYLETIKMMVSVGLGWSVLPQTMLDNSLIKLELPKAQLVRSLGIMTQRERTMSNAAEAFISLLHSKKSIGIGLST